MLLHEMMGLLSVFPRKMGAYVHEAMRMYTAVWLIVAPTYQQPQCPVAEWINKF